MVRAPHVELVVRPCPFGEVWQPLCCKAVEPPRQRRIMKGHYISKRATVKMAATVDKGPVLCAPLKSSRFLDLQLV